MKKCPRCKTVKSLRYFNKSQTWCRECQKTYRKARRATARGSLAKRWDGVMSRCYNPSAKDYANYGKRGINTCERWRVMNNFIDDILSLIGPPSPGMSIDRIDNNGGYYPGNVRWATSSEQVINQRAKKSRSGAKGVSWEDTGTKKWKAQVVRQGRYYYLGLFDTVEEASTKRNEFLASREEGTTPRNTK